MKSEKSKTIIKLIITIVISMGLWSFIFLFIGSISELYSVHKINYEDLGIITQGRIIKNKLFYNKKPKQEYLICEYCINKINKK